MAQNVDKAELPNTALAAARLCNFVRASDEPLPDHKAWLDTTVKPILTANPNAWVDLLGYASKLGSASSNQRLSERRIAKVRAIIQGYSSTVNFPNPVGKGESISTGGDNDDDGRWRAVEVYVYASKPAPTPAPPGKRCGPKIDDQFADVLTRMQTNFGTWTPAQKLDACKRVLIPIKTGPLNPWSNEPMDWSDPLGSLKDINGWDVLPLFQGTSAWLRSKKVLDAGCASGSDPTELDPMSKRHTDPTTCSNTVEIGGQCWLSGNVNYGTYGIMVRLCADAFKDDIIWNKIFRRETAVGLITAYKLTHKTGVGPEIPISWFDATYFGGPRGVPSGPNRDRPDCNCGCSSDGSLVTWDYVWEPVKPRSGAVGPNPNP